ncbi:hypothetical protein PV797_09450 [Clostridiaceae bacterium M8S5]|nr:hypothetical protein PV797_09450 [Clostridiaceae bacterium M8S5]
MRKTSKIVVVTLVILVLSTVCFAGTWHTLKFSGSSTFHNAYITPVVKTSGMPYLTLRITGRVGDVVKVEMQVKDYDPSSGKWIFKTIATATDRLTSNGGYVTLSSPKYLQNDELRYLITPSYNRMYYDGTIKYFTH